jgi:hypothetical protein
MLLRRSAESELMDDPSVSRFELIKAHKELRIINKYLGGVTNSRSGIKKLLGKNDASILDIGSGASSISADLKSLKLFAADLNFEACKLLKNRSENINVINCDAFHLPFKESSFDASHASLFFHHFNEVEIANIVKQMLLISRKGIVINDLRRNLFALASIKILTKIFSKSRLVKNDAPISVKRSFTKKDLNNIFSGLNYKIEIKRVWAFRWLIIIYK